jgi:hypothetical protein
MWFEVFSFFVGVFFSHTAFRIPFLLFPRMKSWNDQFTSHPEPVNVDGELLLRVLHMRNFYYLGLFFTFIPLIFGWLTIQYGNAPLGFGLWLSSGWLLISNISSPLAGEGPPWTKTLAMKLQLVRNEAESDKSCCQFSAPVWEVTAVRCAICRKILLNEPRPDLGRPRSDGKIKGLFLLILSGGRPLVSLNEEEE